ncbi:perlucin-like [Mya arenaria]|uniref:perlucin-like n=1 Tax=Mya arenaria TaxID=6604 RepID=UPI0022E8F97C|nr:perlucin-like [Mya arenaria]
MINLLCFAFTLLATVNSQGAKCPIDFMQFGESCYHIFATPKLTWWDAMSFCGMYGFGEGTLATVESAEEQLFLERELKSKYPPGSGQEDFWLGAYDLVHEGSWVWVKKNEYVQGGYEHWGQGQPSGGTGESCLGLYDGLNYMWNDAPCGRPEGFICEVPFEGRSSEVIG